MNMAKKKRGVLGPMMALVAGAAAGVIFGLFYAPNSGDETREMVREKGIELKDKVVEKGQELDPLKNLE
jgi:gas vesicle protein